MTQDYGQSRLKTVDSQSRRNFLIYIAEGAAITAVTPFGWTALPLHTRTPKPSDSIDNHERLVRLREIVNKAIRSGDRARMLMEADALRLPKSNMLALQSVTIDHLKVLSKTQQSL